MGDMLYLPPGTGLPVRVHGAFVSDEEVHRVVALPEERRASRTTSKASSKAARSTARAATLPAARPAAAAARPTRCTTRRSAVVLQHRRASISLVQRHLRIGYNRAARLLEQMEKSGLVSAMATNGNRDILVPGARRMKRCAARSACARCCCSPAPLRGARRCRSTRCASFVRDVKTGRADVHADRHLARRREEEDVVAAASSSRGRTASASPTRSRSSRRSSADGQKVWIYDADLNQVSSRKLGAGARRDAGGAARRRLARAATSTSPACRRKDGLEWAEATPKAKDGAFQSVRVGFQRQGARRARDRRQLRPALAAAVQRASPPTCRSRPSVPLHGAGRAPT